LVLAKSSENPEKQMLAMHWKRSNATAVVTLQVHGINADWETVA
jgi:hypothetical protein